jgi:hypothetical protein
MATKALDGVDSKDETITTSLCVTFKSYWKCSGHLPGFI